MSEMYRIQEYTLDQGIFRKHGLYELYRFQYNNTNNDSLCRRLVILSSDDPYGEKLPDCVRSWDDMSKLVNKAEIESRRHEMEADNNV